MTRFSESYHLYTPVIEEVSQLLGRANRTGMVVPGAPFTCFCVDGLTPGPDAAVIAANREILVHYLHRHEQGVWLSLFDGPVRVGAIEALWAASARSGESDRAVANDDVSFQADPWIKRSLLDSASARFVQALTRVPTALIGSDPTAHVFARLLGLEAFDTFGGDTVESAPRRSRADPDNVKRRFPSAFQVV